MKTCEKRVGFWRWLGRGIKETVPIFTLTDWKRHYATIKSGMWFGKFIIGILCFSFGASIVLVKLIMCGDFVGLLGIPIGIIGFLLIAHFMYDEGDC